MLRRVVLIFAITTSFTVFAGDTELILYRPFSGEIPLVIKDQKEGKCWLQSQRIKREDAWRCMVDAKLYDPCFIKQYGSHKEAICPQSPWASDSVQLNLVSPVDDSQHVALDMSEAYPWAVELTTGEKCLAVDEGEVYDGLQVRYRCDNQHLLIGRVQRCEAKWSILQRTPKGVSTAYVAKAWF